MDLHNIFPNVRRSLFGAMLAQAYAACSAWNEIELVYDQLEDACVCIWHEDYFVFIQSKGYAYNEFAFV